MHFCVSFGVECVSFFPVSVHKKASSCLCRRRCLSCLVSHRCTCCDVSLCVSMHASTVNRTVVRVLIIMCINILTQISIGPSVHTAREGPAGVHTMYVHALPSTRSSRISGRTRIGCLRVASGTIPAGVSTAYMALENSTF